MAKFVFALSFLVVFAHSDDTTIDQLAKNTLRNTRLLGYILEDTKSLLSSNMHLTPDEKKYPKTCEEALNLNNATNLVTLHIPISGSYKSHILTAYCERKDNKDAWLVIMRRTGSLLNNKGFPNRTMHEYEIGFGSPTAAFWIGLEKMHLLTHDKAMVLRVELMGWNGNRKYAEYKYFRISSKEDGYRLFVDGYSGDAGDTLDYHNGQYFSSPYNDRDADRESHCAENFGASWWFNACIGSCLTCYYEGAPLGIIWNRVQSSFGAAEMKIKPNGYY